MIAICKDNSYTWRNVLTIGKEYDVIRLFQSELNKDVQMIDIICDDGKERNYKAERFTIKECD